MNDRNKGGWFNVVVMIIIWGYVWYLFWSQI